MIRFVLLASQRTGSTWVLSALNRDPRVTTYGELFIAGGRSAPRWAGERDVPHWELHRDEVSDDLEGYLENLVWRERPGVEAVGFKLMYGQAGTYPTLLDHLFDRGGRVIHLVRRNLLDVVVSKEVAVARDVFHALPGDPVAPVTVRLNAGELPERLAAAEHEVDRHRARLADLGAPRLEVAYEDLVADPDGGFEALLAFLGLTPPAAPLHSPLRKLVTGSHAEVIENYGTVADALAGTRWRTWLR